MHGIERAVVGDSELRSVETATIHAPPHIRKRLNAIRRSRGLPEVAGPRRETTTGVWIERAGQLVPVSPRTTTSSPTWSRRQSTPAPLATRVLILPTYGDAPAANLRNGVLPETVSPIAFGTAAELNRVRGWDLRSGHHGPRLALAGELLRAHDTEVGLVVEWIVDPRLPMGRETLAAIDQRAGISVGMTIRESRTMRLPHPVTLVTGASLRHIAILGPGDRPAYTAATAMVFRSVRPDDRAEFDRQLAKLIAEARFRLRRQ
jgi:hypothetical protein